ncbi:Cloroperoxidase [Ascobolus immersus RN42]|uniref:Cloroperoxidase n=1 Tax=Ascobolus immersus RN42 TaxID=1160509 RepID=A0A3N4IIW9_ASCIM|nr:Cloroperoxidase [Ascobolus immersus RN42]
MKNYKTITVPLLFLLPLTTAFPAFQINHRQESSPSTPFDHELQHIDTSSQHQFKPPRSTDHRGPCPALNALANHGYISRTGRTNMEEASKAVNSVFGLSVSLSKFLTGMALLAAGDPWSKVFSIGDSHEFALQEPRGNIGDDLGKPDPSDTHIDWRPHMHKPPGGLSRTQGTFDSDSSISRPDAFLADYGAAPPAAGGQELELDVADTPLMSHIDKIHEIAAEMNMNMTNIGVWREAKRRRVEASKRENPIFLTTPFAGIVAGGVMNTLFPSLLFANHSKEQPDGTFDLNILYDWYGVYPKGPSGWEVRKGWERIPAGFNRIHPSKEITMMDVMSEASTLIFELVLSLGGNVNATDTYEKVDFNVLTGGQYQSYHFRGWRPKVFGCFLRSHLLQGSIGAFEKLFKVVGVPTGLLIEVLEVFDEMKCAEAGRWSVLEAWERFGGLRIWKGIF